MMGERLRIAWGWLCFIAYTKLPWPLVRGRFGHWLLPWAGYYAHSEEP